MRQSLSALGASNHTLELVAKAHRPGTQSVYASHWKSWLAWCEGRNINALQPLEMDIANYLASLSAIRSLSASSISTHRAAISSTLRQLGGPSFSEAPLLRSVIRGAAFADASCKKRVPAWDLFLVLSSLREPPYEPLRYCSIKDLTLKTAFLVTLASGRRCSEVHSLSGLRKDVSKEPHGAISLRFLPEFIAKNQRPEDPSPSILLRSLSHLPDDDPDRKLCPVRALRTYRKRTEPFRRTRRRLLLSHNQGYDKDISKSSVSRWLIAVIGSAYKKSPPNQTAPSTRAHEIRAWSASLALACTRNLKKSWMQLN